MNVKDIFFLSLLFCNIRSMTQISLGAKHFVKNFEAKNHKRW